MRFILASALLIATAVPAFAGDVQHFTRDGETYDYVAARHPDGSIRLTGHAQADNTPFMLNVRNRRVSGTMGVKSVDFFVSKATMSHLEAEVPADPIQTASAGN